MSEQPNFSTENLISPGQIGWIYFREGEAKVAVKVVRDRLGCPPFLSFPTAYYRGKTVQIVFYENHQTWKDKREVLLRAFHEVVGDEYFFNFCPE